MSGRCPVCGLEKEAARHIVCPFCWVRVPDDEQHALCVLFERSPSSKAYARRKKKILAVLRRREKAYRDGRAAFAAGLQLASNPHRAGSVEDIGWSGGWYTERNFRR